MSLWNVIQVVTPVIMRSVKMYIIIIVTLMTTILGLTQTCLNYCKLSPAHSSIPPPDCDCSFHHLRKPRSTPTDHHAVTSLVRRDSEINYEPAKLESSQTQSFHEPSFNIFNFSSSTNFTKDSLNNIKFNHNRNAYNTSKSFAVQDNDDEHYSKFSHKYKSNNDVQNTFEKTEVQPLHLYLDIDLNTSENGNTSQLAELKNMFENFQVTEQDLSECISLHIYIFSKNVNKTNAKWDHKVNHDTLTNSQELTEIQNKCGQSSSIIKQSLYQIKQTLPERNTISGIEHDKQETIYSLESTEDTITQNKLLLSRNNKNSTISSDSHTFSTNNNYSGILETSSVTEELNDIIQSDKNYTVQDDLNLLMNDYHKKQSVFTSSVPTNNDDALLSPTELSASHVPESITVLGERGNLRITTKPNRTIYNEADIKIPRIITKELSNNSILSVVHGNEEIPNSDFITSSISSTNSNENPITHNGHSINKMSTADLLKTTIDHIDKSNLVEIRGNLYVLFDNKRIPARFIQQPNGELFFAIDGFSLCNQMLEENTTNFINSFCNCIQLQN